MENNYMLSESDRDYRKDMICTYGGIEDCSCNDCEMCNDDQLEECYSIASSNCNSEFAESIDYGGYDSEEEFWDNL